MWRSEDAREGNPLLEVTSLFFFRVFSFLIDFCTWDRAVRAWTDRCLTRGEDWRRGRDPVFPADAFRAPGLNRCYARTSELTIDEYKCRRRGAGGGTIFSRMSEALVTERFFSARRFVHHISFVESFSFLCVQEKHLTAGSLVDEKSFAENS